MGKYRVVKPTSYVQGSKVVFHTKPSVEAINIDDAVAGKLGDAVERVGGEPAPEQAEQPADPKPRERNK